MGQDSVTGVFQTGSDMVSLNVVPFGKSTAFVGAYEAIKNAAVCRPRKPGGGSSSSNIDSDNDPYTRTPVQVTGKW